MIEAFHPKSVQAQPKPQPGLYSKSFSISGGTPTQLPALIALLKSFHYEEINKPPEKAGQFSVSSRELRIITREFFDETGEFYPKMNLRFSPSNGRIENPLGDPPEALRLEPRLISELEGAKIRPESAGFVSALKTELPSEVSASALENLQIFTYFVPEAQKCGEFAVLKKGGAEARAIVAIDVRSRTVQAWAETPLDGGKSLITEQRDSSPMSGPFVFLAGLDEKLSGNPALGPLSALTDSETSLQPISLDTPTIEQKEKQKTLREAVELLEPADIETFKERIGEEKVSLVLEAFHLKNSSLLGVTAAYASLAGGGIHRRPKLFASALEKSGKRIEPITSEESRVSNPISTYVLIDMLRGTVNSGRARKLREFYVRRDVAGASGALSTNEAAWFVGFTPSLAVGVWTSDKKGLATEADAVNTWGDFMKCVDGLLPAENFKPPLGVTYHQVDRSSFQPASRFCPHQSLDQMAFADELPLPPTCEQHARNQSRRDYRSRQPNQRRESGPWQYPSPAPQQFPPRQAPRRRGNQVVNDIWNELRRGAYNLWR